MSKIEWLFIVAIALFLGALIAATIGLPYRTQELVCGDKSVMQATCKASNSDSCIYNKGAMWLSEVSSYVQKEGEICTLTKPVKI